MPTTETFRGHFDPTAMFFPTDGITLRQVREHSPVLFRDTRFAKVNAGAIDALLLHYYELILAGKAFAKKGDQADPYPEWERRDVVDLLASGYQHYRLASGRHASMLLIRRFEAAAVEQARRQGRS